MNIVDFRLGTYRHFKGDTYIAITIAKHSETEEDLVIYKKTGMKDTWARPLTMFCDDVPNPKGAGTVPRFQHISRLES